MSHKAHGRQVIFLWLKEPLQLGPEVGRGREEIGLGFAVHWTVVVRPSGLWLAVGKEHLPMKIPQETGLSSRRFTRRRFLLALSALFPSLAVTR